METNIVLENDILLSNTDIDNRKITCLNCEHYQPETETVYSIINAITGLTETDTLTSFHLCSINNISHNLIGFKHIQCPIGSW